MQWGSLVLDGSGEPLFLSQLLEQMYQCSRVLGSLSKICSISYASLCPQS